MNKHKKKTQKLEQLKKKLFIKNKKVFFNYTILEKWEAGIVLTGMEVKAIKNGQVNLNSAYVTIKNIKNNAELFLLNASISIYKKTDPNTIIDYNPERSRKLLMRRKEIKQIIGKIQEKHLTIIPLAIYTKHNKIKVEIALAKGKKLYDKKESIKERDVKRKLNRILKTQ